MIAMRPTFDQRISETPMVRAPFTNILLPVRMTARKYRGGMQSFRHLRRRQIQARRPGPDP
jgi:hypothetical protein